MAYAFDRTMNSLGKQPTTGKVDEPTVLASSAGDPGSGGAGGATPNAAPVRSAPGSSKQAFAANRDRAASPVDVTGLRNRVKGDQAGLYGQQGAYLANAGKQYTDAQPSLEGDVSGYLQDGSDRNNFKNRYTNAPGLNADIKLDPDRNLRDVNALANDASIRNRIRENGGAESRLGDSALDVSLLHADKYFNLDRDALGREYSAEEAARKDIQASSAGLADKETDRKYQVYRDRIKSLLGNEKTRIQAGGENAMDKYNRAAVANASDAVKKRAAEKAALTEAGLDASGDNYDSADEKYFNPSAASTDWTQHVGADDAARWKRTMDLLGGAGPASLSGSKFGTANNDLGFQKESYLADQRARKAEKDKAATAAAAAAAAEPDNKVTSINRGRDKPYDVSQGEAGPRAWWDKPGDYISDFTKGAGEGLSQFPGSLGGSLAENAKELGRQADPSNLLPDKLKRKDSVITSLRRASPKGVRF
jgi:hypothetical protein